VELLEERAEIPQADVVIGGPPCQGYSLVNKQREDDPRNQQWHPYMEVVERSGAKVFVVEKVSQLLGSTEHDDIKAKAAELGFEVGSAALLAANCAVPQTSTTVALSWYHGRRFRIFAGNGIFGPDADGGVARETSGSQPPHGGLFSRATAPSGAALRAQLAE
jgi:hypothetical protein